MRKLLPVTEAAEVLGLSPATIYKFACAGWIPVVRLGARILFDPDELERWVRENTTRPISPSPSRR